MNHAPTPNPARLLLTLLALRESGEAVHTATLQEALGLDRERLRDYLLRLERRGLVDASRATLTMVGLAVAASLRRNARALAA